MSRGRPSLSALLISAALAAVASAGLGSCGVSTAAHDPGPIADLSTFPGSGLVGGDGLVPDDVIRPAVRGGTNGLEIRTWSIQGQAELVNALINVYGRVPTPMPDAVRSSWIGSGFWVLQVPIEDLTAIRERMVLVGPEHRDWFGQVPEWTEIVRGRRIASDRVIGLIDGPLRTSGGVLRLLSRGWTVPGPRGWDAALHIELAVQLQDEDQPTIGLGAAPGEAAAGLVFPRLKTAFEMQPGSALLIVPMGPAERTAPGEAPPTTVGPPEPVPPTLGEAMLTADAAAAGLPVRRRALIVVVPRIPPVFPAVVGQAADGN